MEGSDVRNLYRGNLYRTVHIYKVKDKQASNDESNETASLEIPLSFCDGRRGSSSSFGDDNPESL